MKTYSDMTLRFAKHFEGETKMLAIDPRTNQPTSAFAEWLVNIANDYRKQAVGVVEFDRKTCINLLKNPVEVKP